MSNFILKILIVNSGVSNFWPLSCESSVYRKHLLKEQEEVTKKSVSVCSVFRFGIGSLVQTKPKFRYFGFVFVLNYGFGRTLVNIWNTHEMTTFLEYLMNLLYSILIASVFIVITISTPWDLKNTRYMY